MYVWLAFEQLHFLLPLFLILLCYIVCYSSNCFIVSLFHFVLKDSGYPECFHVANIDRLVCSPFHTPNRPVSSWLGASILPGQAWTRRTRGSSLHMPLCIARCYALFNLPRYTLETLFANPASYRLSPLKPQALHNLYILRYVAYKNSSMSPFACILWGIKDGYPVSIYLRCRVSPSLSSQFSPQTKYPPFLLQPHERVMFHSDRWPPYNKHLFGIRFHYSPYNKPIPVGWC